MTKKIERQVEREGKQRIGIIARRTGSMYHGPPEEYFIAHAPSKRFLYRWNDGAKYREVLEGEQECIDFILKEHLGEIGVTYGNDKWREEYKRKAPSPELRKALIKEVFLAQHYERFKHFVVRKETSTHIIDRTLFDRIFDCKHQIEGLDGRYQNLLDEGAIPSSSTLDKVEHYRILIEEAEKKHGKEWFTLPPHSTLREISNERYNLGSEISGSIDKLIDIL